MKPLCKKICRVYWRNSEWKTSVFVPMNKKNLLFSDSSTAFFAKEHLKMLIKASLSLIFYEEQIVPSSGFSKVIMT